jgi:hypothetical protein
VYRRWSACLVIALLSLTACRPEPLKQALQGELPPEESNIVITEYCQSCHIHRAFDPSAHPARMHGFYDRLPYTATTQCRACHLVRENTWGMKLRKTLWPREVAQNQFTSFERRFLKENPDLKGKGP